MRIEMSARMVIAVVLMAALAALPLMPGLGGSFIFDDRQTVQLNDALHIDWTHPESLLYAAYSYHAGHGSRALVMLSFALDVARGGIDPSTFKATNIAIHVATTAALAAFLHLLLSIAGCPRKLAGYSAIAMATLWAVHPLQVSAVLYIVQRMQTLATLFVLLALWGYLGMRRAQMDGSRSRKFAALAGLFATLALASKEDAALLPLYALLLELTVLRFRASSPLTSYRLRRGYLTITIVGAAVYLFVIVPHYWHWEAYPGRTFSTVERLLSQTRVLVMYVGQILLPLPSRLPFYYDGFPVSRGLLSPATTLPALLIVIALVALAWRLRTRRPLFAFGILLFFSAHSITSNVPNLELAFEHRNHLAMVGIILASGDLIAAASRQWRLSPHTSRAVLAILLAAYCGLTGYRAYLWGEPTRFAQTEVRLAPNSARAWLDLCTRYFDVGASTQDGEYVDKAITTCEAGSARTGSPQLMFNVIVYKALQGRSDAADWPPFIRALKSTPASAEMMGLYRALLLNTVRGVPMDSNGVLQALAVVADRAELSADDYVQLAIYVFNHAADANEALPYLERAVRLAPANSPRIEKVYRGLSAAGRDDWVRYLKTLPPSPDVAR